jgi:phenol 2-monooxygenase
MYTLRLGLLNSDRVFQTFGGFTSGIGIHYAPSSIVELKNQSLAPNLVVGQRVPPQVILRAADSRPYEIQDLLTSDTRFKILVFCGDMREGSQRQRLDEMALKLAGNDGVLQSFSRGEHWSAVFDIVTIRLGFMFRR